MPTSYRPSRPTRAIINPLLSSTSTKSSIEPIAKASTSLWNRLSSLANTGESSGREKIAVAVEWPEDRRLGKGKEKSLVIWVERLHNTNDTEENTLYVHPALLPSFSITPLSTILHIHEPFELSLAIIQPVLDDRNDSLSTENDIDLSLLYSSQPGQTDYSESSSPNGHVHSDSHSSYYQPIIRQNDLLPISKHRLRVLLLEPVSQGILTPSTKIILSTEPYMPSSNSFPNEDEYENGDEFEIESSYSKTHLSLSNFDPDTFLTSDLSLSLSSTSNLDSLDLDGNVGKENENDELVNSISSSTSGSLTPRPGDTIRPLSPPTPLDDLVNINEEPERGVRFNPIIAKGNSDTDKNQDDICWLGVGGLGRAGIFEGDWVYLKSSDEGESSTSSSNQSGRLVKALAWERLNEYDDELPSNPILLPPSLYRSLISPSSITKSIIVQPTSFGARKPTLPIAKTITLARIATSEGVDKRYERSWLKGLKSFFSDKRDDKNKGKGKETEFMNKLVKRGDMIPIPVYLSKPLSSEENTDAQDDSDGDEDEDGLQTSFNWGSSKSPNTAVVYFTITSLSYDHLVPLEEDFKSSISSKARAGELGCWVDVNNETKMVLTGMEKDKIDNRQGDLVWYNIDPSPTPFGTAAVTKLRDLLKTPFMNPSLSALIQLSILVKGARGSGKRSLISSVSQELGYNIINVECYDIIGDTPAVTSGSLLARLEKAKLCSPSLLVLNHVEALAKKTESSVLGRPPAIVKVLEEVIESAKSSTDWPVAVIGTTIDADSIPNELLGCFKQDVEIRAPNESERLVIINNALSCHTISPDVDLKNIARQTAALHAGDIQSLIKRAYDLSLNRINTSSNSSVNSIKSAQLAGLSISAKDLNEAINEARNSYSDSIGAPKIPNVTWDDVGGLANVKQDILDTVQLPLERGDLFGDGLKKRSGILLYGPPGTGKTLLAKAVATSCSLNFLSVKGPELLNMYIGESEANVRRLFQRARDASPCVIFMDELDSVAPKRGNQGDSGGVMDRIVSQLLAELDGMSGGSSGESSQVFVLGATNRPDLLDQALLRPGRFDKMLYLSVPTTHQAQYDILKALTRKFTLAENLDLRDIAEKCEFNFTGADLYALCSDAMLNSMTRTAESIDEKIIQLSNQYDKPQNENGNGKKTRKPWKGELTTQYYLSKLAKPSEIQVKVTKEDFELALNKLIPSVSKEEMNHYEQVQKEFKSFNIGGDKEEPQNDHLENEGGAQDEEEAQKKTHNLIALHLDGIKEHGIQNSVQFDHNHQAENRELEDMYGSLAGEYTINGIIGNEHNHKEEKEHYHQESKEDVNGHQPKIDRKGKGKAEQIDGHQEEEVENGQGAH
ncbi:uncharacterized protein L201_006531 [Kwoniella dendrophila CBS 6074]|uniref:Peroxisomal ATPase PEX6 n=1 Tax=Kwoniella dendrophila CBS 6074 TaxID=1295534 RepID=A0AAX4K1T0_9TREE